MKKLILFVVVVLGIYYFATQSRDQTINSAPIVSPTNAPSTNTLPVTESTRYIAHSSDWQDNAAARKVLFFYASWCSTCIPTDRDLESRMADIPSDTLVIRVNYNDPDTDDLERALATKYGVTYQHTFVQIDQSGEVVTKWNGGSTQELLANIK